MRFRGVEYSAAGERLMRALGVLWRGTDAAAAKARLQNEANVIHAFHAEFPGLVVHESGREPKVTHVVSPDATAEPASRPDPLFEDVA